MNRLFYITDVPILEKRSKNRFRLNGKESIRVKNCFNNFFLLSCRSRLNEGRGCRFN